MILKCDCCQREIDTRRDDFHMHEPPSYLPHNIRRQYESDVFCTACEEILDLERERDEKR